MTGLHDFPYFVGYENHGDTIVHENLEGAQELIEFVAY